MLYDLQTKLTLFEILPISIFFNSSILTPEHYVEMAKYQFDLGYLPRECLLYIFQTVQKLCRRQNQILKLNIDQAALSKCLCVFSHLKELTVHFVCLWKRNHSWEAYIDLDMNITKGLYVHYMQVI